MSARLAAADGLPALAIRLYARAALLGERVGHQQFELGWPDPTPNLGDLCSRVGEATFEEQWERGRAMTLLDAIGQASGEQHEPEPAPHTDERGSNQWPQRRISLGSSESAPNRVVGTHTRSRFVE